MHGLATKLLVFIACTFVLMAEGQGNSEIYPQLGHGVWTQTAVLSKDGKFLLSGGWGGVIKLWDVNTGREMRTMLAQSSNIKSLAISPDGWQAASCDTTGKVKLWDLRSGQCLHSYDMDANSITFLDGGKLLMARTYGDKAIKVWETATGKEFISQIPAGTAEYLISSPDGKHTLSVGPAKQSVMSGLIGQREIKLWDLRTHGIIRQFLKAHITVHSFTPDGNRLLSVGLRDSSQTQWGLTLWDAITDREIWTAKLNTASIDSVLVTEDGSRALSVSQSAYGGDGTARIWDLSNGRELQVIPIPKGLKPIQFSRNGEYLLFGNDELGNKLFKLYECHTAREIGVFTQKTDGCETVAFAPDGKRLVLLGGAPIILRDIKTGAQQRFEGNGQVVATVAFDPNKNRAAMVESNAVSIWDITTGNHLMTLKGHEQAVTAVAFSPGGIAFVSGSRDTTLRFWDLKTGKERVGLPAHSGGVLSVAYSPDGRRLVSGGNDALVKLWDGETGELLKTLSGHIQGKNDEDGFTGVHAVTFSPDGTTLASAGADGTLRLWDATTGSELRVLRGHTKDVISVAFSPNGLSLVTGGSDKTVRLWDPRTGKELKTLGTHEGSVSKVVCSPDGKYIASRGYDESVKLWSAETGLEIRQFQGTRTLLRIISLMTGIAFSPDSRHLLTCDSAGVISRLWDVPTGKEVAQFIHFTDGEWITITPEGYFQSSPQGARHLNVRTGIVVSGVDQFFSKFYRPEIIQLALAGGVVPPGEKIADIARGKPAPTVRIASPVSGSSLDADHASLSLKIQDSGGGIGNILVFLNGVQVANDARGILIKGNEPVGERTLSFAVPLVEGSNEIRAIAFNQENSMESAPALVTVQSRVSLRKPDLYALVIGIDEYRNKSIALKYAVSDAGAFADTLKRAAAPLFSAMEIQLLTTPETTSKAAIVKAFEGLRARIKPNDLFIFYDASHGIVDVVENEEQYFLLTSNVLLLSSRHIGQDALGHKELAQLIGNIPAQKKIVFLDTCNAGKGGKEIQIALLQQTRGLTESTAIKVLQRSIGSAVFSASSDTQLALEGYQGHGLFTFFLLQGLQGKADIKQDGYITVRGLADYVEEQVISVSESIFKKQQAPTIQTSANFPIGKVQGEK